MSATQRAPAVLTFPRLFRRRRPQPELTDGHAELAATYWIIDLLAPLPYTSQERALSHAAEILEERARQLAAFEEAQD